MWGLAYKDLLLMRRSLWYYAFLLVIFTAFVLTGSLDAYILSGMAMLFSYMVPLSSFSLDEAARWGEFAAATPACLRGIVDGKYLCSLLTAAGGGGAVKSVREIISIASILIPREDVQIHVEYKEVGV